MMVRKYDAHTKKKKKDYTYTQMVFIVIADCDFTDFMQYQR